MTKLEIEQKKIIEKQQHKINLMRKLATSSGFFEYYFSILKKFKTQCSCFHEVNDMYFNFFGEYKYSDYNSFRNTLKRQYKK
jgi:hypothetical protein